MKKNISIIIPIHNGLLYTKQCLVNLIESLKFYSSDEFSNYDYNIVVVDDGSTDDSKLWIERNYPEIVILSGNGNLWWSGAINVGCEFALDKLKSSYVLFWNNDIFIKKDYFVNLDKILINNDSSVIVASKIFRRNEPEILFSCGAKFNTTTGRKKVIGAGQKDSNDFNQILEIDWCGGMGTTISKDVFYKIGYCDNIKFPQYDGDSDFFIRARKGGFSLKIFPSLNIWNDHENTGAKQRYSMRNYYWWLTDMRSYKNIKTNFGFINKHSVGILPYVFLCYDYARFTCSYAYKWFCQLLRLR